jgi:5-methylcytosine-specific restriction endonuclease McrA
MNCFAKTRPIRLDRTQYSELHRAILQRDGWRCQVCGTRSHLEVHHQQFRSQSGEDTEGNLITLCHECHSAEHGSEKNRNTARLLSDVNFNNMQGNGSQRPPQNSNVST